MQRYFVAGSQIDLLNREVKITGDDVKHITRVLRMQAGDVVIVADGQGTSCLVKLLDFADLEVIGEIVQMLPNHEPKVKITLAQGLPKGDKMDLIVQKGTEIGISEFIPLETVRSIVKYDDKKRVKVLDRWGKIAKEAAEQAHRDRIPEIATPRVWRQFLSELDQYDLVLVPYEMEKTKDLKQTLQTYGQNGQIAQEYKVCIVIGPEGGFDQAEIDALLLQDAHPVTLGPRIMRTETAGLVTAAVILYEHGEMGGV